MQNYMVIEIDNIRYMVRIRDNDIEVGYLDNDEAEKGWNRFIDDVKAVNQTKEQIATILLKRLKFWI